MNWLKCIINKQDLDSSFKILEINIYFDKHFYAGNTKYNNIIS